MPQEVVKIHIKDLAKGLSLAIAVEEMALKTGLRKTTVEDLLSKGWGYQETLGEPPRWVHPFHQLEKYQEK